MKQKLISRLVVGALAAVAATSSFAGQIQSSSVSIAREVITTNTQAISSPSISYRFAGDVDARSQDQTFQVQFVLGGAATWAGAGTANSIVITDGVSGEVAVQGTDYNVTTLGLSADKKTLYATITVPTAPTGSALTVPALIKQPLVTISATGATTKPSIDNLFDVVGTIGECDTDVKPLTVDFKHFVALADPSSIANGTTNGVADEHSDQRAGTNSTTLITFPTNVLVAVAKSTGTTKLNVSGGNTAFAGATDGLATDSWVSTSTVNLGAISLKQNAQGYDSNLINKYLLTGNAAGSGLTEAATAALVNGNVETEKFTATIAASQGFVVGGKLFFSDNIDCSTTTLGTNTDVAITSTNASGPVTLTIPTALVKDAFGTTGTGPVYVCYNVPGTAVVPASAFTATVATLDKANAGAPFNEQNNYCKGTLYSLTGSIKIDVRNYATSARADGWMSVLRLINPSETRTATVYGQFIHKDGQYGKWGKLADLAPRAVLQMVPADVTAALTNAPAHATTSLNATADVATSGDAPRLRITSETTDTLRVQNYLYNPATGNFIEASSSQGVDYAGTSDRAPCNGAVCDSAQFTEQDAQLGLNGGN